MKILYLSLSETVTGYAVFEDNQKQISGTLTNPQSTDQTNKLKTIESLLRQYEPERILILNNTNARYLIGGIRFLCSMFSVDCQMGPSKPSVARVLKDTSENDPEAYAIAMQRLTLGGKRFE